MQDKNLRHISKNNDVMSMQLLTSVNFPNEGRQLCHRGEGVQASQSPPHLANNSLIEIPSETQDCFCRKIIWSRTATFNRSSEEYFAEISWWWSDIKSELKFCIKIFQHASGCGHVGTAVSKMPFKIGEVISLKINDI